MTIHNIALKEYVSINAFWNENFRGLFILVQVKYRAGGSAVAAEHDGERVIMKEKAFKLVTHIENRTKQREEVTKDDNRSFTSAELRGEALVTSRLKISKF